MRSQDPSSTRSMTTKKEALHASTGQKWISTFSLMELAILKILKWTSSGCLVTCFTRPLESPMKQSMIHVLMIFNNKRITFSQWKFWWWSMMPASIRVNLEMIQSLSTPESCTSKLTRIILNGFTSIFRWSSWATSHSISSLATLSILSTILIQSQRISLLLGMSFQHGWILTPSTSLRASTWS